METHVLRLRFLNGRLQQEVVLGSYPLTDSNGHWNGMSYSTEWQDVPSIIREEPSHTTEAIE